MDIHGTLQRISEWRKDRSHKKQTLRETPTEGNSQASKAGSPFPKKIPSSKPLKLFTHLDVTILFIKVSDSFG